MDSDSFELNRIGLVVTECLFSYVGKSHMHLYELKWKYVPYILNLKYFSHCRRRI